MRIQAGRSTHFASGIACAILKGMGGDVRFAEISALFKKHGWWLKRVRGSHHHFTDGQQLATVPVHHGKVKYVYYRQIKKLLGEP